MAIGKGESYEEVGGACFAITKRKGKEEREVKKEGKEEKEEEEGQHYTCLPAGFGPEAISLQHLF